MDHGAALAVRRRGTSACRDMVPLLAEMVRRKSFDPTYSALKLRFDLQCAVDEKRYDDAYPLLIRNEKVNGPVVAPIAGVMIVSSIRSFLIQLTKVCCTALCRPDAQ